ncbi:hypothetical protein SS1G_01288 [Sclerotinia sclerotiorum 1980 UF-70]|uniref:Response regulatory domain-containing protein n=1 Tax=Sclerotinia sclerotiorum (strain ATCC 18683 / 1980 / Ss-1) TaxID=665079 RepID=A7E7L0_SCLS1|nr:hypothetical protein SS1G_01288 [Sclerotinia sclerotiorum 1980 UF-70]EDN96362.1 hypothetical protein SS1G_01288 [Sclerotinia sclerotiorum 1980 UF-70]
MLSSLERKRIREVRRYYKRSPDDPPIAGENVPAESPETIRTSLQKQQRHWICQILQNMTQAMIYGWVVEEVVPEPNHYACFSVPDLMADPRFCNLPYVAGGPRFRYYAGTPLISDTGIPIGSVFVIDPRPREPATRAEIDFLGLMAKNVMEYLEMKRESVQLRRNDVMSKGLAALVEGQSRIPRQVVTDVIVKYQEVNGISSDEANMINPNLRNTIIVTDDSLATVAEQSLNNIVGPPRSLVGENPLYDISPNTPMGPLTSTDAPAIHDRILSRGANLLRESLDVDYTIFFDMSIGFSTSAENGQNGEVRSPESATLDASDTGNDFTSTSAHLVQENGISLLNISARPCSLNRRTNEAGSAKVRSFSTSTSSSLEGNTLSCKLYRAPNEKDLQRLSKRYPKGKVWTFNGYDSESSEGEDSSPYEQMFAMQNNPQQRRRVRKTDRSIMKRCFPDAREVLFAPLSEAGTGLPIVACFAVSLRDIAIFTSDTEKAFVRGFLNSVSIEYNRISIAAADRQKGNFISNISHELKSPLHGILGSAELLSETGLDNGQFELCSTIETCGRVLQETLMDVLEYSKLKKLKKDKRAGGEVPNKNVDTSDSKQVSGESLNSGGMDSLPLDLARMCEDSVAIVAAAYMHHRSNSEHLLYRVMQPPGTTDRQDDRMLYKCSSVTVSLHIAFNNWHFFCSPGSVQRIIMNLVGNSLKYTSTGFIDISLTLESAKNDNSEVSTTPKIFGDDLVVLRVSDSGKGISSEFLKSKLFIAFSQESSIAPGTEETLDVFLSQLMKAGSFKPSLIIVVRYVSSQGHTSQHSSIIGIPIESMTIPFGPWKLLKTLITCLSQKKEQLSPTTLTLTKNQCSYNSPMPPPMADVQKELEVSITRPAADGVSPDKPLAAPQNLPNPSQPTILCVDDNPINLRILKTGFRKLNFDITCAENGAVAFDKYRLQPNGFDLVLMDLSMPVCNGYDSTRMIRCLDNLQQSISPVPLPPTRIVALSAACSEKDREKAKAAGMDDLYMKPMKLVFKLVAEMDLDLVRVNQGKGMEWNGKLMMVDGYGWRAEIILLLFTYYSIFISPLLSTTIQRLSYIQITSQKLHGIKNINIVNGI